MSERRDRWIAYAVLASAAFYHPLSLLAANAWEISSPGVPLLLGLAGFLIMVLVSLPLRRLANGPLSAASIVAVAALVAMNWDSVGAPILVTGLFVLFAALLPRAGATFQRVAAYVLVGFFGVASLLNLVVEHVSKAAPYPVLASAVPIEPVQATGAVEDVLVVVVDQYPASTFAENWFGHDSSPLHRHLSQLGYETIDPAWSTNTFTILSIPSLLELRQVGRAGSIEYGNRRSLMDIMSGDNFTVRALQSAGFTYHHVEGGWEANTCGRADVCHEGPFFDEMMFKLFDYSVFGAWLEESKGSYFREGALHATGTLESLQSELGDGDHDFIFGHLLLPHDPYVVDADCNVLPERITADRIAAQLACADKLLMRVASLANASTAVLITGDHGTNGLAQRDRVARSWTDPDVAERFSVLLTYRMPDGCRSPDSSITIDVMRALMRCTVDVDLPERDSRLLIGADDPEWVDEARMTRIVDQVLAGTIVP